MDAGEEVALVKDFLVFSFAFKFRRELMFEVILPLPVDVSGARVRLAVESAGWSDTSGCLLLATFGMDRVGVALSLFRSGSTGSTAGFGEL